MKQQIDISYPDIFSAVDREINKLTALTALDRRPHVFKIAPVIQRELQAVVADHIEKRTCKLLDEEVILNARYYK